MAGDEEERFKKLFKSSDARVKCQPRVTVEKKGKKWQGLCVLVGPVEKPRLPAACVPVRVFSQMAADKLQLNMVLILLLAPVQLAILWFEDTRDLDEDTHTSTD